MGIHVSEAILLRNANLGGPHARLPYLAVEFEAGCPAGSPGPRSFARRSRSARAATSFKLKMTPNVFADYARRVGIVPGRRNR